MPKFSNVDLPMVSILLFRERAVKTKISENGLAVIVKGNGSSAPKSTITWPSIIYRFDTNGTITRCNHRGEAIVTVNHPWEQVLKDQNLPAYCMGLVPGVDFAYYDKVQMVREVRPRKKKQRGH